MSLFRLGSEREHWFALFAGKGGISRAILFLSARNDPQNIIGKWPLQFERPRRVG
jgi:hypothetical protein